MESKWDKWQKYIDKFNQRKINCLDIGAYTGESTCWMLNNICNNNNSKVFSIDTWDQYTEDTFDTNIRNTRKEDSNIKMKMKFKDSIILFKNYGFITFDIIFIDVNREENNVLIDAILAWDLLDLYGIIIFYNINASTDISTDSSTDISTITSTYNSTPYMSDSIDNKIDYKTIIKNFINLFKLHLVVKYDGNQYIIKKLKRQNDNKPELKSYYNLLETINNFKLNITIHEFNNIINDNIDIELRYSKNNNIVENTVILARLDKINKMLEEYPILINKYEKSYNEFISKLIKDDNLRFNNLLTAFRLIPIEINRQIIYRYASKYITSINSTVFVSDNFDKEMILDFITNDYKIKRKNINILEKDFFTKTKYDKILKTGLTYDYIYILFNYIKLTDNCNNINNIYNILQSILLLNMQAKNGCSFIKIWINLDIINIQMLYILKKYYKSFIISYAYYDNSGFELYIRLNHFLGINKDELDKLNSLVNLILENMENYTINCITINSIANITSLSFIKFKYDIFNMLKVYLFIFEKHINILKNIFLLESDKNINTKYLSNILQTYYSKRIIDIFNNI